MKNITLNIVSYKSQVMKFLKELTPMKVIILMILLFVAIIVIDILTDPQGALRSFKEGYEAGYKAAISK